MTNSVTVVGEVNRLGSLTFNGSFAYEDYLELAAGTTDRSSRKDIYVIKANGKVVFSQVARPKLQRFRKICHR